MLLLHPVETYHVKFMHDRGCWWLTGCLTCYKTWSWQLPQNIDNLILRGIAPYTRIFYAHSSGLCRCLHFLLKDKLIFCKWMMLLIFSVFMRSIISTIKMLRLYRCTQRLKYHGTSSLISRMWIRHSKNLCWICLFSIAYSSTYKA